MARHTIRWRRKLGLFVVAFALVPLAMAEVATRLLTRPIPETGMAAFFGIPLLPYRPTPEQVRAWLRHIETSTYVRQDSRLGWTIGPSSFTKDRLYESNAQAARARADVTYGREPPPGKRRLVAVGDSFTHGDGVSNEETWEFRLEALRSDLEVVNLGVPGYGTDQAFLRWRHDGVRFRPDFVVLGIWPENICRNLNVVRYFLQPAGGFAAKPRFLLSERGFELTDSPVLDGEVLVRAMADPTHAPVLTHDYWVAEEDVVPKLYQQLHVARVAATLAKLYHRRAMRSRLYSGADPGGIAVTVTIAEQFGREVAAAGEKPLVVLLPMRDLLEIYPDENSLPLARALLERGIEPIDLGPRMTRVVRERGAHCCFAPDGHLSPEGNDFIARWLAERLAPELDEAAAHPSAP